MLVRGRPCFPCELPTSQLLFSTADSNCLRITVEKKLTFTLSFRVTSSSLARQHRCLTLRLRISAAVRADRSVPTASPFIRLHRTHGKGLFATRGSSLATFLPLLAFLLLPGCSKPTRYAPSPTLAILHATVIDATGGPSKPDTTVVLEHDKIALIAPAGEVSLPPNTPTLDAAGKFLIPGLVDSHVHLTAAGEPDGSRRFILPLLVANGITAVRDMGGSVELLKQLRSEIADSKLVGPQIFFTGPYLDGYPPAYQPSIVVKTPADATSAVDQLVLQGVDFVKVQSRLEREPYFAIAAEAKKKGIRFVGHVPDRISAFEAAAAGQASVEHLTGVLMSCSFLERKLRAERSAPSPPNETPTQALVHDRAWRRELLDTQSPQQTASLLNAFLVNGTWQVPTFPIVVHLGYVTPRTSLPGDPRLQYVPAAEKKIWEQGITGQLKGYSEADFALREEIVRRSLAIVGQMQKTGIRIMAGTDLPAPNVFPGSSLHEDLAYLVAAGLAPMQALQAASKNPAEFLNQLKTRGTIEPNKVADLVLLDANPLEDIHNTQKIRAVVLRGKLFDRSALDALLSSVAHFASAQDSSAAH